MIVKVQPAQEGLTRRVHPAPEGTRTDTYVSDPPPPAFAGTDVPPPPTTREGCWLFQNHMETMATANSCRQLKECMTDGKPFTIPSMDLMLELLGRVAEHPELAQLVHNNMRSWTPKREVQPLLTPRSGGGSRVEVKTIMGVCRHAFVNRDLTVFPIVDALLSTSLEEGGATVTSTGMIPAVPGSSGEAPERGWRSTAAQTFQNLHTEGVVFGEHGTPHPDPTEPARSIPSPFRQLNPMLLEEHRAHPMTEGDVPAAQGTPQTPLPTPSGERPEMAITPNFPSHPSSQLSTTEPIQQSTPQQLEHNLAAARLMRVIHGEEVLGVA